jgi:hypothetical protein
MPSQGCKSGRRDLHALGAYFWRTFLRLGDDDLLSTSICSIGEGWLFMARWSCWKKDGARPSYFGTRPGSGPLARLQQASMQPTTSLLFFLIPPRIHVFVSASSHVMLIIQYSIPMPKVSVARCKCRSELYRRIFANLTYDSTIVLRPTST